MQFKYIKCGKCNNIFKVPLNAKQRVCDDCQSKSYFKNLSKRKEWRKEHLFKNPIRKDVICQICKEVIKNAYPSTRYCGICAHLLNLERTKKKEKDIQEMWSKLDEKEKQRRIEIISQEFLYPTLLEETDRGRVTS